jgi:hypothetical protein
MRKFYSRKWRFSKAIRFSTRFPFAARLAAKELQCLMRGSPSIQDLPLPKQIVDPKCPLVK